jgi:hypothetical protein
MSRIKKMAMESFSGAMDVNIKDNGRTGNNMEKEFWLIKKERKLRLNGLKGKELKLNREINPITIYDYHIKHNKMLQYRNLVRLYIPLSLI